MSLILVITFFFIFFILNWLFFNPSKTTSKPEEGIISKASANSKAVIDSKKRVIPTHKPQKVMPIPYEKLETEHIAKSVASNQQVFPAKKTQKVVPNIYRELETEHIASTVTSKKHRITHCYSCHTSLNNRNHKECESCGWISCPVCNSCSPDCKTKDKSTIDFEEVHSDSSISNSQNDHEQHNAWQTLKNKPVPVHEVRAYFLSALERKGSANPEHLMVYANCLSEELRGNLLKAIIFKAIPSNLDEILDEIELKKFTISDALQQAIETTMNTGTRFENKINDMSSRFNNKPGYYEEDCDGSPYDFGQDVFSASDGSPYDYSDVYDDERR
jgi:hypothetical protein